MSGRTIARDLTVGLALTIALVVVSVGGINYATSVKQVDQELERKATDIIGKLADILGNSLWIASRPEGGEQGAFSPSLPALRRSVRTQCSMKTQ